MMHDHFSPQILGDPAYPAPTLLDVTLRDGGFPVGFAYEERTVRAVVGSLAAAGVQYVEVGYHRGVPDLHGVDAPGLTADIPLPLVRELAQEHPEVNLAVMVHPGMATAAFDLEACSAAGVRMVRFVYHPSWHAPLGQLVSEARSLGMVTSINLALASRYSRDGLMHTTRAVAKLDPDVLYLADTCSALYPHQVEDLVRRLREVTDNSLGIHAHDFLSLAFANTLAGARAGARFVDGSLGGLGRGAGNLRTEIWCLTSAAQGVGCFRPAALLPALDELRRYPATKLRDDLLFLVAGAFNLTPPEEQVLRNAAAKLGWREAEVAALYAECGVALPRLTEEGVIELAFRLAAGVVAPMQPVPA